MNKQQQQVGRSAVLHHSFVLGVSDFHQNSRELPASTLLRLAAEARYQAFSTWPALVRMLQEEGNGPKGGGVEIRTQIVRFTRTTNASPLLLPGLPIHVTLSPLAIGANHLTIACEFYSKEADAEGSFAQVFTLLARVNSADGSLLQLPNYVGEEIVWQYGREEEMQASKDQAWLYDLLFARASAHSSKSLDQLPVLHRVLIRPSDFGGRNAHRVAASRLAEYFEDALLNSKRASNAEQQQALLYVPDLLVVEMMGNVEANQECNVVATADDGNEIVLMLLDAHTRQVLARSYVHWQFKMLTN